ncbi:MAG: helix-turn-helix domain-containing protein [Salinibacter sp.]
MATDENGSDTLNDRQRRALALIALGWTDQDVAAEVGVTRQTVNEWKNQDDRFIAELNKTRKAVWNAHVDRLRDLVSKAVAVLSDNLENEDPKVRHQAAVSVLRSAGLYGKTSLEPDLPTTPEGVQEQRSAINLAEMARILTRENPYDQQAKHDRSKDV